VVVRILKQDSTMIPMPDVPAVPKDLMRIPASEAQQIKESGQQMRAPNTEAPAEPAAPALKTE
jgi:hypothetical protein